MPIDESSASRHSTTGIDNIYNRDFSYELYYDNVFESSDDEKENGTFVFYKADENSPASVIANITTQTKGHIYLYLYSRQLDNVTVSSSKISTSMTVSDGYILDLGNYNENEAITVEMPFKDQSTYANVGLIVFTVNHDKFVEGYAKLKSGQIEYTNVTETKIDGTFTADENEVLYTSIPYDKAWEIFIDGEKVTEDNIIKISDALLGVKVTPGKHSISFNYSIPGTTVSLIISII